MYTVDANVIARDADPTDPDYPACHALLEELERRTIPMIVPNLILAELSASISRVRRDPIRARIVVEALQEFEHIQFIALDMQLAHAAAELAADRFLRGADAVYVAVARRYGCTLVTLDQEQRERSALVVRALTPLDALHELAPERPPG